MILKRTETKICQQTNIGRTRREKIISLNLSTNKMIDCTAIDKSTKCYCRCPMSKMKRRKENDDRMDRKTAIASDNASPVTVADRKSNERRKKYAHTKKKWKQSLFLPVIFLLLLLIFFFAFALFVPKSDPLLFTHCSIDSVLYWNAASSQCVADDISIFRFFLLFVLSFFSMIFFFFDLFVINRRIGCKEKRYLVHREKTACLFCGTD